MDKWTLFLFFFAALWKEKSISKFHGKIFFFFENWVTLGLTLQRSLLVILIPYLYIISSVFLSIFFPSPFKMLKTWSLQRKSNNNKKNCTSALSSSLAAAMYFAPLPKHFCMCWVHMALFVHAVWPLLRSPWPPSGGIQQCALGLFSPLIHIQCQDHDLLLKVFSRSDFCDFLLSSFPSYSCSFTV